MRDAILWYGAITIVGWLSFPLSFWLFRRLPDRGYAFSRTLGWLVWGYSFWLLTSLHLIDNRSEGILFAFVLVFAFSLSLFLKIGKAEFSCWWKENRRQVGVMEGLFALAFIAMAVTRAANPEALGTEKPMELAFINAILRSETFPPHDPWLSGYAISYYYFGYILVAMLAKLCATSGAVAFNLGITMVFALSALGAYGLLSNLLSLQFAKRFPWKSLLAPLMVLLVGNLGGLLEVLHAAGLFWQQRNGVWVSPFWKWLDLVELSQPPQLPLDGLPKRWYWWWRASRVVQDYDVSGAPREIIDEFPAFSYILADLHPHVLAMPFALLAMALALSLWLSWNKQSKPVTEFQVALGNRRLVLRYPLAIPLGESLMAALILGGLAFLNTWDFPIYVALCAAAYALGKVSLTPNPSPTGRGGEEQGGGEKPLTVLQALNFAIHQALAEDERVFLLGQDLLDPYGGAFKVTQGCSSRFPQRVFPTPISEAGLVGMASGMAIRGLLPLVEIMFGDFLTLIADQVINHMAKFRWMYNDAVRVPLVIRAPVGGGRGYGPTHSQSLEKLYFGVPGIHVVAVTHFGEPQTLLYHAVFRDEEPVIFIEHKSLYPLPIWDDQDRDLEREVGWTALGYPTYTLRLRGTPPANLTLVAYSYMAEVARQAMIQLAYQAEIFCELVVLTQLRPYEDAMLTESVQRTGSALVIEEGTLSFGWGAEILARLAEQFHANPIRVGRIGAAEHPIPASPPLERATLPGVEDIFHKARSLL